MPVTAQLATLETWVSPDNDIGLDGPRLDTTEIGAVLTGITP